MWQKINVKQTNKDENPLNPVTTEQLPRFRTTAQRESDLFITSMITDRIGRHEVLLPINHKNYNFREKKIAKLCDKGKFYIKKLIKDYY